MLTDNSDPRGRLLCTLAKTDKFHASLMVKMNKFFSRGFYLNHLLKLINSSTTISSIKIELTQYFTLLYATVLDDTVLKDDLLLELFTEVSDLIKGTDSPENVNNSLINLLKTEKYQNSYSSLMAYFIKLDSEMDAVFRKAYRLYKVILSVIISTLRTENNDFYERVICEKAIAVNTRNAINHD